MRYGVVYLTGRHAPSQSVLKPWYEWLQADFLKIIGHRRHQITEREKALLMGSVSDKGRAA